MEMFICTKYQAPLGLTKGSDRFDSHFIQFKKLPARQKHDALLFSFPPLQDILASAVFKNPVATKLRSQ